MYNMLSQLCVKGSALPLIQTIKFYPFTFATACISCIGLLILYKIQNKLIYLPTAYCSQSPKDNYYGYRNPNQKKLYYEDLEIKTEDNCTLRGWYIYAKRLDAQDDLEDSIDTQRSMNSQAQRLVVYFHQNAQNIGTRLDFVKEFVTRTNSDMILVAYRGYSDSQGQPSEKGLKYDAKAIMNEALIRVKKPQNQAFGKQMPIYIFGRSLGGAVGIYSASLQQFSDKIAGIVLENTFTNIISVASSIFPKIIAPFFKFMIWIVCRNFWQSQSLIKNIKRPILFIKSGRDQLIPKSQMDQLEKEAIKHQKTTYEYLIQRGRHNYTWQINRKEYFSNLNKFFETTQNSENRIKQYQFKKCDL